MKNKIKAILEDFLMEEFSPAGNLSLWAFMASGISLLLFWPFFFIVAGENGFLFRALFGFLFFFFCLFAASAKLQLKKDISIVVAFAWPILSPFFILFFFGKSLFFVLSKIYDFLSSAHDMVSKPEEKSNIRVFDREEVKIKTPFEEWDEEFKNKHEKSA